MWPCDCNKNSHIRTCNFFWFCFVHHTSLHILLLAPFPHPHVSQQRTVTALQVCLYFFTMHTSCTSDFPDFCARVWLYSYMTRHSKRSVHICDTHILTHTHLCKVLLQPVLNVLESVYVCAGSQAGKWWRVGQTGQQWIKHSLCLILSEFRHELKEKREHKDKVHPIPD